MVKTGFVVMLALSELVGKCALCCFFQIICVMIYSIIFGVLVCMPVLFCR